MKVSYYSLGCKVNEYEANAIINEFLDHGYDLVDFTDQSDVYIINTCTVTATSDSKSRKAIRQAIKRNPNSVVAVMGCFAQLNHEEINKIEGVDVMVGTSNRHLLFSLVEEVLKNKNLRFLIEDINNVKEYEELKLKRYANRTRAFIKIQDGCDNFCSYCAIPLARGRVRSRKPNDVIEEIQLLTDQGMKEIILTGINTGAYGCDFDNYSLTDLLDEVVKKVHNLGRIRISSIEVTEFSDKLLKVIKENQKHFCYHFHIPLQGGSNETLKRMNRKYTILFYQEKINHIRSIFKDVNITSDILTGFSGETEEDFIESKQFIESMNFGEMHVFPYSKRPNTLAYKYPDVVSEVTKKFRVNELIMINKEKALEYRQKFLGKILEVIVEKNNNGICFGHSSNYLEIQFTSSKYKSNDIVYVRLEKANYPISYGKVVNNV